MKNIYAVLLTLLVSNTVLAGQSAFYFISEPGDWVGQGQELLLTDSDSATFTTYDNYQNGVSIRVTDDNHWFYLNFAAPLLEPLTVGVYPEATRYPFNYGIGAGLSIYGDGRGCNTVRGSFEVKEIEYYVLGAIQTLAVDFTQYCEYYSTVGLNGSIRINSDIPVNGLVQAPIIIENELNENGCIEATSEDGAQVSLSTVLSSDVDSMSWQTDAGYFASNTDIISFQQEIGTVEVTLVVEDGEGNSKTNVKNVCVSDTTAPVVTILSPFEGEVFVGNNLKLEVEANDTVNQNINGYDVSIISSFSGEFSEGHSEMKLSEGHLDSINKEILVTVTDASGNVGTASVNVVKKHNK